MLSGYDLSSNNTASQLTTALLSDFLIVKSTEGATYVNPVHDSWVEQGREAGLAIGHYHYARLSNATPNEVSWFLAGAKAKPGDVLVLDFEPYGQTQPVSTYGAYVLAFAKAVRDATGVVPWLYTNDDMLKKLSTTPEFAEITALMPLWKAGVGGLYVSDPSKGPGNTYGFKSVVAFQWTDTPFDRDVFYGDVTQWHALGVPMAQTLTPEDVAAVAKAVVDGIFAKRFPKAGTGDTISLSDYLTWNHNVADLVKALPKPPVPPAVSDLVAGIKGLVFRAD